ncbi:MAG: cell division protein FtsH [Acidobacteria bacterium]|nr:MAG: cell division protein FtsH [Acidobacteriota bacterium]PYQ84878.1 MAG: cell division protein FtsH [Acidobacteriota bacterium]PYR11956.1 MAG: cell division protein FtsH [Acidobacteriota bacterium]
MLRCEHISASPAEIPHTTRATHDDLVGSVRLWRTGRKALECHVFGRKWSRRAIIGSAVAVLVLIAAVALLRSRSGVQVAQVPFSDLLRHLDRGALAEVVVNGDTLDFKLRSGEAFRTTAPANYVTSNAAFVPELARRNVRLDVRTASEQSAYSYGALVLGVGFVGLLGFTLYRVTTGRIPALESKTREADPETATVTFDDVAGVDEAKAEVKEIVDFLREPERFSAIGGRIPKGVLLVGPPGTGKTLLARSIAGEAKAPFLFASGSDFVEMYAGVGASRIRKLFRDARRHPSCIVFIDELDAVGRSRGGNSLSHEEREQTLNQLLVEMDGFAPNQGIVIIAATNRPDILDPALLRPGRFDRQVTVGAPDVKGREQILKIHSKKVALDTDIDLRQIARGTPGFSGADLANLINEAALFAVRSGRQVVTNEDLDQARDKVLMGVERKSLAMSEHERITCAYHEAGHAVVAALLPDADPLHKVTIVPRGRALGVTMQLPEGDRYTHTREFLDAQLAILMGGRVAEELFLRQMTSGAGNDIERATDIARRMVCEFGMSTLGPLAYRTPGNPWETDRGAGISEATAQRVDEEVHELVMRGYETARQVVAKNRAAVRAMAEELLAVESLDADAIKTIIANAA